MPHMEFSFPVSPASSEADDDDGREGNVTSRMLEMLSRIDDDDDHLCAFFCKLERKALTR